MTEHFSRLASAREYKLVHLILPLANAYQSKIAAENELMHQRMRWFMLLQTFLFAAAAIVLSSNFLFFPPYFVCLAGVGVISSSVAFESLRAATRAMEATEKQWIEVFSDFRDSIPALAGGGSGCTGKFRGRWLAYFVPLAFAAVWSGTVFLLFWPDICRAIPDEPWTCPAMPAVVDARIQIPPLLRGW